jgi:hypothetical protein
MREGVISDAGFANGSGVGPGFSRFSTNGNTGTAIAAAVDEGTGVGADLTSRPVVEARIGSFDGTVPGMDDFGFRSADVTGTVTGGSV